MRATFIFSFFFCFLTILHAQNNYKPGYLISNNNDTIRGLINLRINKMNSKACQFKQTEEDDVITYSPGILQDIGL